MMWEKDPASNLGAIARADSLGSYSELRYLDRNFSTCTLLKALAYKIQRRLIGVAPTIDIGYRVGYKIFDRDDLDGGGSGFGQDYVRILSEIGATEYRSLFEFCSGPGYIGFSLLANGFCRHLTLADVNPVAIEAVKRTIELNRLANRVSVYLSNGFDQIPLTERWDLVVGNPPHFAVWNGQSQLRCEDPEWGLHRRFYLNVKRYLSPGAMVLLQENALGSGPEMFAPMIVEGGGRLIKTFPGPDLGSGNKIYYLLSRWD